VPSFRALCRAAVAVLLAATSAAAAQRVAIPSYFYPGTFWTQLESAIPTVGLAIINPASGPGPAIDPAYVAQVNHTKSVGGANVVVIAYVDTAYAARPLADVEADIDTYYGWYAIDGIFLDEVNSSCADEPYYATLDAYVKAKGGAGVTVLNPGIPVPECLASAGDILLTFEGSYAMYQSYLPMGWEQNYDPSRFWHLIYATSTVDEMATAVALSKSHGVGWVYVTQDTLPNPWDTLPSDPYWSAELARVQLPGSDCQPMVKAKLTLNKVNAPPGDDKLALAGEATFTPPLALDPVTNGARLVIQGVASTILDVTLAGGAAWKANRTATHWTYKAAVGGPGGITQVTLQDRSASTPGLVKFSLHGKAGTYPATAGDLPLLAQLVLDPTNPSASCSDSSFVTCTLKTNGTLRCP